MRVQRRVDLPMRSSPTAMHLFIESQHKGKQFFVGHPTQVNTLKNDESEKDPMLILQLSTKHRTVIDEVSYADRDKKPSEQKLTLSVKIFQTWRKEGGSKDLNLVIHRNIQNPDTNAAVNKIHAGAGVKDGQSGK